MGPKHSSNDDVLETGPSNNTRPGRVSVVTAGHLHVGWWRGSVSRPPLCVLHIKSFMEAIKCVLNGQELAE